MGSGKIHECASLHVLFVTFYVDYKHLFLCRFKPTTAFCSVGMWSLVTSIYLEVFSSQGNAVICSRMGIGYDYIPCVHLYMSVARYTSMAC